MLYLFLAYCFGLIAGYFIHLALSYTNICKNCPMMTEKKIEPVKQQQPLTAANPEQINFEHHLYPNNDKVAGEGKTLC